MYVYKIFKYLIDARTTEAVPYEAYQQHMSFLIIHWAGNTKFAWIRV